MLRALSVALAASATASIIPLPLQQASQRFLGSPAGSRAFRCDLPPALEPSDKLPSAEHLFSSEEALARQVERHQAIVRVPSVCYDDLGSFEEDARWGVFDTLHEVLAKTYPVVHKRAKLEKVNKFGLVYTIQGSDPSLKPVVLAGHQDVVPVADESTWEYPPFEAHYDGTWLWGRGSADDKTCLTGIFSVFEALLSSEDYRPARTVILAFGFDEECSGFRGARHIGEFLVERYGEGGIEIVFDEGGLGMQQEGDVLYVLPAVMEKGHVDVWLELHVLGGHSSIPFPHTGIGIISEIVATLEANPYEVKLLRDSPVYSHAVCQARYSPDANPALTESIENDDLEGAAAQLVKSSRIAQFLMATSQSADIIFGGVKINAMPEVVTLGVNYRVAPQDSVPEVQHNVVRHIRDVVAKYGLKVKAYEGDDRYAAYVADGGLETLENSPEDTYHGTLVLSSKESSDVTPASPITGPVWDTLSGTIQHAYRSKAKTIVPTGEIMTGNTDTRHYLKLSKHVYRWTPGTHDESSHIHTVNERVNMNEHMDLVRFYYDLVRNFDALRD